MARIRGITSIGVEGRPRERVFRGRRARSACEVAADEIEELVVEQATEVFQLGLEAEPQLGDEDEEAGPVMAGPEHAASLPEAAKHAYFAPQTRTKSMSF